VETKWARKQADKTIQNQKLQENIYNSCDSSVYATAISNPSFDMKIPMQELQYTTTVSNYHVFQIKNLRNLRTSHSIMKSSAVKGATRE
jgi:hypothetical protein